MFRLLLICVILLSWSSNCLVSATNYSEIVKNHIVAQHCRDNETCVRFCCDKDSNCTTSDNFELKSLEIAKNLDSKYKVLIGWPNCDMYQENGTKWEFFEVITLLVLMTSF